MYRIALAFLLLITLAIFDAGTAGAQGHGYVVQPGETLWGIAGQHGVSVKELAVANGLRQDAWVYIGQHLRIPDGAAGKWPGGLVHTVRRGDTLWGISRRYHTTVTAIMIANGLRSSLIYPGQRLRIPMGVPTPRPTPVPSLPEVFLSPWSGPPGTEVGVQVVRFPPWAQVQIAVGPYGSEFSSIMTVTADGTGQVLTRVRADGEVGMNLVIAARTAGPPGQPDMYASAMFRIRH